jgi:glycosyltransferase involved in cell wall biosynthesis
MLDIFTKYLTCIQIESKETPDVISGIMEGFVKMGEKPKRIYSDNEGALKSNVFEKYCKEYDISYFAQISKEKGIEDFLELVVRLKEKFPTIRAIVIGGGNELYIKQIKKKIVNLDLSDNIYFAGFQKTQNDAFELLIKSKVYVLPTYYDGLPGTIRESMYLKVAVVAYAVGGIPRLNDNIECIKSVPVHDIDVMLNEVTNLLVDEQKRTLLINNAFSVITQDYSNDNVLTDLVNIYKKILYEQKN